MSHEYQRRFRGPKSVRRDKELKIRLTSEELESVRAIAAASGMHMADFVRRRLLDAGAKVQMTDSRPSIQRGTVSTADPALVRQVASIGSNLNQIARTVNRQALQSQTIQVVEMLAILLAIERQVSELCRTPFSRSRGAHAH
jgi:hypothetical protein